MRIGQKTVVGDTKYIFTSPNGVNNLVIFDVHNDSPYNMGVSFGRDTSITNCDYYTSPHGVLTGIVPPSIDKRTIGGTRWQGNIYIYTETPVGGGGSTNLASAPASSVTVIGYQAGYQPQGQVALNRMQTTANTVATNVGSLTANSVTNDGNTAPSTFIEATQSGNASGSNVAIGIDGSFSFAQFVSSNFTNLLQLIPGASPLLRLGAKLIVEAVDNNNANLSNIFGVDSSGNTFLQSHKNNNQTIIYDKNSNPLLTIDANACLKIAGALQTSNGDTSGTLNIYEGIYGIYKVMLAVQKNYEQAGGAFQFTLKNLFSGPAFFFNGGCGGMQLVQAGSVQSLNCFATIAATGGTHTAETISQQDTFGWCNTNFNQIGPSGGYVGTHTGIFVVIGI